MTPPSPAGLPGPAGHLFSISIPLYICIVLQYHNNRNRTKQRLIVSFFTIFWVCLLHFYITRFFLSSGPALYFSSIPCASGRSAPFRSSAASWHRICSFFK